MRRLEDLQSPSSSFPLLNIFNIFTAFSERRPKGVSPQKAYNKWACVHTETIYCNRGRN